MNVHNTPFEFEFETDDYGLVSCRAKVIVTKGTSFANCLVKMAFMEFTTLVDGVEVFPSRKECKTAEEAAFWIWDDLSCEMNS